MSSDTKLTTAPDALLAHDQVALDRPEGYFIRRPLADKGFDCDGTAHFAASPSSDAEEIEDDSSEEWTPLTPGYSDVTAAELKASIRFMETSGRYVPIARTLLLPDTEKREFYQYQRDIAVRSYVIPNRGVIPVSIVEAEEVLITPIAIGAYPTIRDRERNMCKFDVDERMKIRAEDSIRRQEDIQALSCINAAVNLGHSISVNGAILPRNLRLAMAMIEAHEIDVHNIVMHPIRFKDLFDWDTKYLEIRPKKERRETGIWAYYDETPIRVSTMCARNSVFALADPKLVGRIPIEHEIETHYCNDRKKCRSGFTMKESVGIGVINDYTIARILVSDGCSEMPTRVIFDYQQMAETMGIGALAEALNKLITAQHGTPVVEDATDRLTAILEKMVADGDLGVKQAAAISQSFLVPTEE